MPEMQTDQKPKTEGGVQERGIGAMVVSPTFQSMLKQSLPNLGVTPERMSRIVLSEFRKIPQLALCTPASFVRAVITCAELGLVPGSSQGLCWLIPFRNKVGQDYVYEATFVLGYPGAAALAWRSGQIDAITARTVYAGDKFQVIYGTDEGIHHEPQDWTPEAEVRGFYATMRVRGSEKAMFHWMTLEEVIAFRDQYVRSRSGPWHGQPGSNEFRWMAQKTCFKQVAKLGPRSEEVQGAFNADDRGTMGQPPEIDITGEANLLMKMMAEGDAVNAEGGFGALPVAGAAAPDPEGSQAPELPHATAPEGEPTCDSPIDGGCVRKKGHNPPCMSADGRTEAFE